MVRYTTFMSPFVLIKMGVPLILGDKKKFNKILNSYKVPGWRSFSFTDFEQRLEREK